MMAILCLIGDVKPAPRLGRGRNRRHGGDYFAKGSRQFGFRHPKVNGHRGKPGIALGAQEAVSGIAQPVEFNEGSSQVPMIGGASGINGNGLADQVRGRFEIVYL